VTPAEHAYLAGLGFNAAPVLAAMNASSRFSGERSARNYMSHYATFSGKIRDPVFTLHTKWDTLVPWGHESAYAETVAAAGRSDLLLQASTSGLRALQLHAERARRFGEAARELGGDRRKAERRDAGAVRPRRDVGAADLAAAVELAQGIAEQLERQLAAAPPK
jgi:hypothetical protein